MFAYVRFLLVMLIVTTIALNVVAFNFTRLTGNLIDKPVDFVLRKGDLYISVMNKKTKISGEEVIASIENFRNKIPENEDLFEELKRWYNMTRTFLGV